jgi:hypothetical protein
MVTENLFEARFPLRAGDRATGRARPGGRSSRVRPRRLAAVGCAGRGHDIRRGPRWYSRGWPRRARRRVPRRPRRPRLRPLRPRAPHAGGRRPRGSRWTTPGTSGAESRVVERDRSG